MKRLSALVATVVLALCFGAGQAVAMEGGSGAGQDAGQSAGSGQSASGGSGAYQLGPSNSAGSIRVLSPGDNGSVSQSNNTTAGAVAANLNKTDQSVDQSQTGGGGYGSDSTQIAGQEAKNAQHADADATAKQLGAKNDALSIRVLSPGDDGDVTQSNSVGAGALAANGNQTDQSVDQSQAGGGKGSDSTQITGQDASNKQSADADAKAVQVKPTNSATSIRVLSPGDDGDVTQSNNATALAAALNLNDTEQTIDQQQTGSGHGSDYLQIAGQGAWSGQHADADAKAIQLGAKNEYTPVRVGSPNGKDKKHGKDEHGKDAKKAPHGGSVEQSNSVGAFGLALNLNKTYQPLEQSQTGHGSSGLQVGGQGVWSGQDASADAFGLQGVMRSKK